MQQQLSVVTLGIADKARSKGFYCDGFGWAPVFENEEIVFYQMNGFVLGTWLGTALAGECAGRWAGRVRFPSPTTSAPRRRCSRCSTASPGMADAS